VTYKVPQFCFIC